MTDPGTTDEDSGTTGTTPASRPHRRRWLRWAALLASVLVLAASGTGWALYKKLDGNIRTDYDTADELAQHEKERPAQVEAASTAQNILLLGSDNRGGGNGAYGRDEGSERSDTAILLHVAADRRSATGVSIPRDLMVDIPSCKEKDGSSSEQRFAQFNWAFQTGGTACAIRTVEKMTDIRVDHHLVVDFQGFKKLVDAVDGVDVCLVSPVHDRKPSWISTPDGRPWAGRTRSATYAPGTASATAAIRNASTASSSFLDLL